MKAWVIANWKTVETPILDENGQQTGVSTTRVPDLPVEGIGFAVALERPLRCLVKVVSKNPAHVQPFLDAHQAGKLSLLGRESNLADLLPKLQAAVTANGGSLATWRREHYYCGED
jgi:hypothetical protein